MFGEEGRDVLVGDTGNDSRLNGGQGRNAYYFNAGDGTDKILDEAVRHQLRNL